ncbi:hypothetical protein R6Q59_030572 [Mikania micrantha]
MVGFKGFFTKKTLIGLFLGQILSLFISSTGFSSSELSRRGINALTSQSLANYMLLAIVYGGILIRGRNSMKVLPYAGFAAAMFLFYSGVPLLLKISGSTMLNLSLLTSDMCNFAYIIRFDKEVNEQNDDTDELEKSRHFDKGADVAGSVKLNILARSSNAGSSRMSSVLVLMTESSSDYFFKYP